MKRVETLILLLKSLSLMHWFSDSFSEGFWCKGKGCRMQGKAGAGWAMTSLHLTQLSSYLFHIIRFHLQNKVSHYKQMETKTFVSLPTMLRSLSGGFHHFLVGLFYCSSH